jgi:hypothetical protein
MNARFVVVALALLATSIIALGVVPIVLLVVLVVGIGIPALLTALLTAVGTVAIVIILVTLAVALTLTLRVSRHVGRRICQLGQHFHVRFTKRQVPKRLPQRGGSSLHEVQPNSPGQTLMGPWRWANATAI